MSSTVDHAIETLAVAGLEALEDAVILLRAEPGGARAVYMNAAAARLLGNASTGTDPERWDHGVALFDPETQAPCPVEELPHVRALAGTAVARLPLLLKSPGSPQGKRLLVSATPLRCAELDGEEVAGVALVLAEARADRPLDPGALHAERERKAILDNIQDMAWLKDREGRFIAVNQKHLDVYQMSRERFIGHTDYDVYPRELAERFRADDAEVMKSGRQRRVEERIVDANGQVRWLETIKMPVLGEQGEVVGTTGTARDITERKATEEALRSMNDELERRVEERTRQLAAAHDMFVRRERLAVLGQLAGGVAHQIRNPLAAIMNASYVLERQLGPHRSADTDDALLIVREEIRHADVIISSLLDYARVRPPDRSPASLVEIIERALVAVRVPDNVRVERSFQDLPPVHVDADQMLDAVINIVRNAVEAMPEGGVLRVEVGRSESGPEEVVMAVNDTGPGICPTLRKHLFEPLHSTKPRGVGLGLITARTLVEAHGGRLVVVDVPVGVRFEIHLPIG